MRTLPNMSGGMTYAHLGRSGLLVSRIALGTMDFGYLLDEASSFDVMDTQSTRASTTLTRVTSTAVREPPT
jgi:aryl-alcohol dehydrogenase-like predicted oxidoreductase